MTGCIGLACWLLFAALSTSAAQTDEVLVITPEQLNAAIAEASPGDVIVMQDGVWQDVEILFEGVGTEEQPITLKAETNGKTVISGASSLRLAGEYLVVDGLYFTDGASPRDHLIQFRNGQQVAHHSRITNIVVSEFSKPRGQSDVWVGLFGTHNRVDHSFFHGKTSQSTLLIVWRPDESPQHHQIDHNYFKDIPVLGMNGAEAIRVGTSDTSLSDSHTTIEYNLFEQANGEGELISLKSGQNVIRHNTVIESQGSISLRHGNGNLVQGNFIFGGQVDNTGGIRVMGEDHTVINNYMQGLRGRSAISLVEGLTDSPLHGHLQVKNATISGNTMIDNDRNILIGEMYDADKGQTMKVTDSILKDNVIRGVNRFSLLVRFIDEPHNMSYEGNIMYEGYVELEDEPGLAIAEPPLTEREDGMYEYEEDSPLKDNIIGEPLRREDAGPAWIHQEGEMFGIQPDVKAEETTDHAAEDESEVEDDSEAGTGLAMENDGKPDEKGMNYSLFIGIVVLVAGIVLGTVRIMK